MVELSHVRLWWDEKQKLFRAKTMDLAKVPLKYRCPSCGQIVVKPKDRSPTPRIIIPRFAPLPPVVIEPRVNEFEQTAEIELAFYGGVCEKCWLDGFGQYGKMGKSFSLMMAMSETSEYKAMIENLHLPSEDKQKTSSSSESGCETTNDN